MVPSIDSIAMNLALHRSDSPFGSCVAAARASQQKVREVEQFLELVVNFQNDPMAVRIIGSAPLSLPLPHFNFLVQFSLVQFWLAQQSLPQAVGAFDRDATGEAASAPRQQAKRPPSGRPFP
ncbi:hypothetical protein [Bradyrhizobium quebecense]|uniref:Uncharacterized protein n=2 Tax=Bradyrhizobium quebecense TaxID=2748629 RepID=A0ACD3VF16_9BRAD|nr:hypothetical protein [Bradyrhizobium quebecense]UGY05092.1 hypothetical protein J4P68_0010295 [Bradyrhizobium quebecense]